MPHDDDLVLIQRIIHKDQNALTQLYAYYGRRVYNLAHYIVRHDATAEEVTQDVFLQIWRSADKWDESRGRLISWILTITRHTAIDRLRKDNKQLTLSAKPLEEASHYLPDTEIVDDPKQDNGRLLRALITELPADQKRVIQLAYFKGMTHSEIASELNLPLGTVKSRLRLALGKLKVTWMDAIKEKKPENE